MPVIYIPRVFGGTLVLGSAQPTSLLPTTLVVATFRSGQVQAQYRDGETKGTYRDGNVKAGGR